MIELVAVEGCILVGSVAAEVAVVVLLLLLLLVVVVIIRVT